MPAWRQCPQPPLIHPQLLLRSRPAMLPPLHPPPGVHFPSPLTSALHLQPSDKRTGEDVCPSFPSPPWPAPPLLSPLPIPIVGDPPMLGPEPQIWSEVEAVVEGAPHTLQLELSPGGGAMVSILDALDEVQGYGGHALAEGPFLDVLRSAQEAIVLPSFVAIAVRPRPGVWEYVGVNVHELSVEQLTIPEYL